MGFPTSSSNSAALIVADTSAVINLNATGYAQRIIRALPKKFVVVDVVPGELDGGRAQGRRDADLLRELVDASVVKIVTLDDLGIVQFEKLVIGPAVSTLDDGEAATIAYAATSKGIAVLDERKATRICTEMFPKTPLCSTVDLLAHPEVRCALGETVLRDAVFRALVDGRMRVLPEQIDWVLGLIGPEKALLCSSLPASVRRLSDVCVHVKQKGSSCRKMRPLTRR